MYARRTLELSKIPGLIGTSIAVVMIAGASLVSATGNESEPFGEPRGPSSAWLSRIRQQIAASEYDVTWQDRTAIDDLEVAWGAPNRAQDFRTYFTEDGIRVVPRTEEQPSWEWGLKLIGYARDSVSRPVAVAVLSTDANRVDCDRGEIVEWYVNSPEGLKQSFRLNTPIERVRPGTGATLEPAYLVLELTGDLSPFITLDGQAIDFRDPGGRTAVRYAGLRASDALGREVRAWFEALVTDGMRTIRIAIDDRGATYPVTIDPLATSPAWTAESNQPDAHFGMAGGTAGDVNGDGYADVIVGAEDYDNGQSGEGRAYVYHGSASGLAAVAAWTAESNQSDESFGTSVGTAGDVNGDGYADVIIGAEGYDNGETDEGRAYVYHGSSTGLAGSPWTAESNQAGARFGGSVSTAGDVNADGYGDVIVAAYDYDNGETDEGRAYVYHGSSSGLSGTPWTAESDQASSRFGISVSTAGDVNADGYSDIVVGADGYGNGETDEGRAYVYYGSSSGLSGAPWTAESDQADAHFGRSVSAAGDVNGDGYADVIIGAQWYDDGETDEGRAYVYHGSAAGLSSFATWTAEGNQADAHFGVSVSTAGDMNGDGYADVIVGANAYDNGETDEGQALVYPGSAIGLSPFASWTGESDQAASEFGSSVSTAGDVNGDGYADVIVGAAFYDNGEADEGRAYVYHGGAAGLQLGAAWSAGPVAYSNATFGTSVSMAGDVNGDGYADVVVVAGGLDKVFGYYGSSVGLPVAADWEVDVDASEVSAAGDVNGDGYADVIVGASGGGPTDLGAAYVYHGSASGLASAYAWMAQSDQAASRFGNSVSTAGDVNGDGYADVIVGAYWYDKDDTNDGQAYVYHGSASGLEGTPAWVVDGEYLYHFGNSVSTAGDVNADGYSDVIVGAYNRERAYVFHGSDTGLEQVAAWWANCPHTGTCWYGYSVSTAGDVNGDGYADVIIGAPKDDGPPGGNGYAYVYHGSATGVSGAPWTATRISTSSDLLFGDSVSTAGDVNGDGYADVIVGARGNVWVAGDAFAYHGSASGLSSSPAWAAETGQVYDSFGTSVSTAGDVNGDGYADVIVGASLFDFGLLNEGRVYFYYGNNGPGLSIKPEQRQVGNALPIAPLCASDSRDGFRLELQGRTPFGRGSVRLEWEVKPFGSPFDGTGTSLGASYDTGAGGVDLSGLQTGLQEDTLHHWRVRLQYDPVTVPLARNSRWITVPWNGWQEADLRTATCIDVDGDGVCVTADCDDYDGACLTDCNAAACALIDERRRLVVLPDLDGSGASELAVLHTDSASGDSYVYVKDALSGNLIRRITAFGPNFSALALVVLPDFSTNSASEIAVLGVHRTDGRVLVRVKDAFSGQLLNEIAFSANYPPRAMVAIPSFGGGAADEIGLLGIHSTNGKVLAKIKDAESGVKLSDVYFSPNYLPRDLVVIPSFGGTAAPELALLGTRTVPEQVMVRVKDASSGVKLKDLYFSTTYPPQELLVIPSYAGTAAVELGLLGVHRTTAQVLVRVKDASSGTKLDDVYYSARYAPRTCTVLSDFGQTAASELSLMGVHDTTNRVMARVKDPSSGAKLSEVWFSENYPPEAVVAVPSVGGSAAQDIALLGRHVVNGNVLVRVKDALTGALIVAFPIP